MAKGMAGARWRQLLGLLIVTSGATLAWVKTRRRQLPGSMPRSWSELDSSAPASLRPAVREPVAEEPAAQEPVAEEPAAQEPVAEEPAAQEPVGEEPAAQEPTVQEPAAQEPTVQEPVAEEPGAQEPTVQEPGAEAPAAAPAEDGPTPGPYPGSVLPLEDGSAPSAEFVVKGNAGSMRAHSADSPYFGRTRAEVWFRTQQDAAAAGFAPWAPKK
jgi:hypothetical protein